MEGLAEKVSRLPPELQREVEDYIDFLLSRQPSPPSRHEPSPDFLIPATPAPPAKPIIMADEIPFRHEPDILPGYKDLGQLPESEVPQEARKDPPVRIVKKPSSEPGKKLLDWID